ncbi:hypothetical protein KKF84_10795 [Myxococcota bacterium]|nr:hypothetical protein [Myxococcota bacterium]MBU1535799.1 hypothetical protein [Myxococcota bacterium]
MGKMIVLTAVFVLTACVPRQDEEYFRQKMANEKLAMERWQQKEREKQLENQRKYREELLLTEEKRRLLQNALYTLRQSPHLLTVLQLKLLGPQINHSSLGMRNSRLPAEGYALLAGWTGLRYLYADNSLITDAGLIAMGSLPHLTSLSLSNTAVSDAGMEALAKMPSLKYLDISKTNVTDKGLAALGKLTSLTSLNITGTKITGTGFASFPSTNKIVLLNLANLPLTVQGMKQIGHLGNLVQLILKNPSVNDTLFMALKGLPNLHILDLRGSRVTAKGFAHVAAFKALEQVYVPKKLPPKALNALRGCPRFTQIRSDSFRVPLTAAHITAMASKNITGVNLLNMISTKKILVAVGKLGSLLSLAMVVTRQATGAYPSLRNLKKLKTLDFSCSSQVAGPAPYLGGLTSLEQLSLSTCTTDLAGIRALSRLKKLRNATLHILKGSEAMVPYFVGMKSLRQLYITNVPDVAAVGSMRIKRHYRYRNRHYRPTAPMWLQVLATKRPDLTIWFNGYVVRNVQYRLPAGSKRI